MPKHFMSIVGFVPNFQKLGVALVGRRLCCFFCFRLDGDGWVDGQSLTRSDSSTHD